MNVDQRDRRDGDPHDHGVLEESGAQTTAIQFIGTPAASTRDSESFDQPALSYDPTIPGGDVRTGGIVIELPSEEPDDDDDVVDGELDESHYIHASGVESDDPDLGEPAEPVEAELEIDGDVDAEVGAEVELTAEAEPDLEENDAAELDENDAAESDGVDDTGAVPTVEDDADLDADDEPAVDAGADDEEEAETVADAAIVESDKPTVDDELAADRGAVEAVVTRSDEPRLFASAYADSQRDSAADAETDAVSTATDDREAAFAEVLADARRVDETGALDVVTETAPQPEDEADSMPEAPAGADIVGESEVDDQPEVIDQPEADTDSDIDSEPDAVSEPEADGESEPAVGAARSESESMSETSRSHEPAQNTEVSSSPAPAPSRRAGEVADRSVREGAEVLTSERLLDRSAKRKPEPEGAWPSFVYRASGRLINLGDSKKIRAQKHLSGRIKQGISGGARFVPIMSRKGGVGKTTVTALLGMALADARSDRVIAVDANPDRGTLAERIAGRNGQTVRDLVRHSDRITGYAEMSDHVVRDQTRLDVLASDTDPLISEAFGEDDYRTVADVAAHYYSIVLTDTGTGIVHSVMRATLDLAEQLVIVTGHSVDEARLASETLTWLENHGYADKARSAIVVINQSSNGTPLVREDELVAHFSTRVDQVITIPFDAHLATGSEITFADLQPQTRIAARELAASVVDGLRAKV